MADAVRGRRGAVEPGALEAEAGLSSSKVTAAVNRREEAGALEVRPTGEVAPTAAHSRATRSPPRRAPNAAARSSSAPGSR